MKRINKLCVVILTVMLFFQSGSLQIHAASNAAFYVQTAAALEDNTIEVSVYLDEADNLGGIDVELLYDPQKVTFVSSSLGASLSSSYADINHDAESGDIHYIILYPETAEAHGVLMNVTFQLKEGKSYQPQLKVNDVIDAELNDISYTVSYQQADGAWAEQQDTSGTLADEKIVQETLEEYGSKTDIEGGGSAAGTVTLDSDNKITGTIADGENENAEEGAGKSAGTGGEDETEGNGTDGIDGTEEEEIETSVPDEAGDAGETEGTEESADEEIQDEEGEAVSKDEKSSERTGIYIAIVAVVIIAVGAVVLVRVYLKTKNSESNTEDRE